MQFFDSFLTVAILLPFTLLALFYLYSIIRRTLHDREHISGWRAHAGFVAILFAQLVGLAILGVAIYLALYAGLGT